MFSEHFPNGVPKDLCCPETPGYFIKTRDAFQQDCRQKWDMEVTRAGKGDVNNAKAWAAYSTWYPACFEWRNEIEPQILLDYEGEYWGKQGKGVCFTIDTSTESNAGSNDKYYLTFSTVEKTNPWSPYNVHNTRKMEVNGQKTGKKGHRVCTGPTDAPNNSVFNYVVLEQRTGTDGWKILPVTADINPGKRSKSSRATTWFLNWSPYNNPPGEFWVDGNGCEGNHNCCGNKE